MQSSLTVTDHHVLHISSKFDIDLLSHFLCTGKKNSVSICFSKLLFHCFLSDSRELKNFAAFCLCAFSPVIWPGSFAPSWPIQKCHLAGREHLCMLKWAVKPRTLLCSSAVEYPEIKRDKRLLMWPFQREKLDKNKQLSLTRGSNLIWCRQPETRLSTLSLSGGGVGGWWCIPVQVTTTSGLAHAAWKEINGKQLNHNCQWKLTGCT